MKFEYKRNEDNYCIELEVQYKWIFHGAFESCGKY